MKKNLFLIACGLFALMVSAYPQSSQKSQYGKQYEFRKVTREDI